jgi:hypothetical protein
MLDAWSEMREFFIHRQHTEWVIFIVPRKPQCLESYRVLDNVRGITVQAYFTRPAPFKSIECNWSSTPDAHEKTFTA